jgi:hypothetical protein
MTRRPDPVVLREGRWCDTCGRPEVIDGGCWCVECAFMAAGREGKR